MPVFALQLATFGWRINREIAVGDQGRRTWFPLPDVLNILSMVAVSLCCFVLPTVLGRGLPETPTIVAAAYLLITFHPISMTFHYRLFTRKGRYVYIERKEDFPYVTGPEMASVGGSLVGVALVVWFGLR